MSNTLSQRRTFNQVRKESRMDAERFAFYLASEYSKHVPSDGASSYYELSVHDLPEDEKRQFAALILSADDSLASEATGYDNSLFDKKMLPSLLAYMKNPTDADSMARLAEDWASGTTSYLNHEMQQRIDAELEIINNLERYN